MGNNLLKFIIIFGAIILVAGFAAVCPVKAQSTDILDIEFESGLDPQSGQFYPLFTEANILPGESVTRWVKVTNKTNDIVPIAAKAANALDNGLGSALILTIKEQGASAPAYSDNLANFIMLDGVYLSDLAGNSIATYDFIVNFEGTAGNEFHGASSSFDIIVGDGGSESFGGENAGSGSGGGYYYHNLRIYSESVEAGYDWAAIEWSTNIPATSRVIYDDDSHFDIGNTNPPNYGYEFSSAEQDTGVQKTETHSVYISGLAPLTTYYFRPLSKASPEKYGIELSFATTDSPGKINVSKQKTATGSTVEEENPSILGWEGAFAASGFSRKEFIILITLVCVFLLAAFILKRKARQ